MLRLCVLLNQFPSNASFAKNWIVSSKGTLVKRAMTPYQEIVVADLQMLDLFGEFKDAGYRVFFDR